MARNNANDYNGFSFIPPATSLTVIILGLLSLLCWQLNFEFLYDPDIAWIFMKPFAALGFVLTGTAVWLLSRIKPRYWLIKTIASLIFFLALAHIMSYLWHFDLNINQYLFVSDAAPIMSVMMAINFLIMSIVLFFWDKNEHYLIHQSLLLFVFFITLFEFLNFIYGGQNISTFFNRIFGLPEQVTSISLIACTALLFLIIGMLFLKPYRGIAGIVTSHYLGGYLARRLFLPVIFLPILLGYLRAIGEHFELYNATTGRALLIIAITCFLFFLVLYNVYYLDKIDKSRKRSEDRLTLALQSAGAGSWYWDIIDEEIYWDSHMFRLFGLEPGSVEINYETAISLIHPDDREKVRDQVTKAVQEGFDFHSEYRIISPDGLLRFIEAKGKVYRDAEGNALRMIGICQNVTHRKRVEAELQESKQKAEKLAVEAQSANLAKSAFLAAMSHEIRTPLNGVIGMTSLIMDTPLSTEQKDYVETIRLSGESLLSVINNVLDFSKIEAGKLELENTPFNLRKIIYDVTEMMAIQAHKKGLAIGTFIEANVPEKLAGDPSRLRQIIMNLVSNAVKFTNKGEISMQVSLLQQTPEDVWIKIEVTDTGVGIKPEIRDQLFNPFSQGDVSVVRRYGGTGLGLAIVKRLVELMGGEVRVDSVLGQGSKFWLTLKFKAVAENKISYRPSLPKLEHLHLLCVDDNEVNREIIKKQTATWQMNCDVAENPEQALTLLRKAHKENKDYQLIILDHDMPDKNGVEFAKQLQTLPEFADIPLIMMTSLGTPADIPLLKKAGIQTCLTKPVRQSKLYETIVSVLEKKDTFIPEPHKLAGKANEVTENREYKKAKILLVEDNPVNQKLASTVLSKLGYKPNVVTNGLEALDAMQKASYDIVLLDCLMPELDGYETVKIIREIEKNQNKKHTIVIAMTAQALSGDKENCLAAGMDDYISKPFKMEDLKVVLDRWL